MGSSPAYPSDLTDAQWALIEPLVPVLSTRGRGTRGGRPPRYSRRRIIDALLYVDRTGCSWRQLPHDFPPWQTVFYYFSRWAADGTTDRIHDTLRAARARCRRVARRRHHPRDHRQTRIRRSERPRGWIRWPRPARWTPRRCPAQRPLAG